MIKWRQTRKIDCETADVVSKMISTVGRNIQELQNTKRKTSAQAKAEAAAGVVQAELESHLQMMCRKEKFTD